MKDKPRTVGDLYRRIMLQKLRERPVEHFYLTIDGNVIEITSENLNSYKNLVPTGKLHDKWDEFVHFVI